jgi:predicted O-methyltransferase YrrM
MNMENWIATALTIPGWTQHNEARELVRAATDLEKDAVIVEVGVFMGRCSFLLANTRLAAAGGELHCIDPFDCTGDAYSVPHYQRLLAESTLPTLYEVFMENMRRAGTLKPIRVHEGTATAVAKHWNLPIDLLLLDADQSVHGARAAFEAWTPFLKPGGTLVLCNTADRTYATDHDGYRRIALEEVVEPRYSCVRRVEGLTFATKGAEVVAQAPPTPLMQCC